MPYHVHRENIKPGAMHRAITSCKEGIYGTFESAASEVVSTLLGQKDDLTQAILDMNDIVPGDLEKCSEVKDEISHR